MEQIEHRLFSHISMNWRGRPLTSHEVIVETIAATTTDTGLTVHAELDQATYPTDINIAKRHRHPRSEPAPRTAVFHGEWNYSSPPATPSP